MAILSQAKLLVIFVGAFVVYLVVRLLQSKKNKLPPGPRGLPVLGNILDLPPAGVLEADHWGKHKEKYGPISCLTVLGQNYVIINDADVALDVLRDQAVKTSNRPNLVFCCEMYVS